MVDTLDAAVGVEDVVHSSGRALHVSGCPALEAPAQGLAIEAEDLRRRAAIPSTELEHVMHVTPTNLVDRHA